MQIEDLTPDHLRRIDPREGQEWMWQLHQPEDPLWYTGPAWACIDDDGTVFAIVGLILLDEGYEGSGPRYRSWTVFSKNMGARRIKYVARNLHRWMNRDGHFRRIEAMSEVHQEDEIFWMTAVLGFRWEGRMRAWTPDGQDVYLFSKIKGRDC
jgi:hypothetical protein